jgi:hypothetical protein
MERRAPLGWSIVGTLWLVLTPGCDDEPGPAPATSARPSTSAQPSPAPSSAPAGSAEASPGDDELETVDDTPDDPNEDACAPESAKLAPMQLLRFTLADGIEGKDPKSALQVARPAQRVYAHLRIRNRSGRKRCLVVTFTINGDERTRVTLKVGKSWSWRTWAYATPRSDDRGHIDVRVTDDQGVLIVSKRLPIVAP